MASLPGELPCVSGQWLPVRDEMLACQYETGNVYNPFAVKVVKTGAIVGYVPRKISSTSSLF